MIVKIADIKKSVNGMLKAAVPGVKLYGIETKQGYVSPCFFVQILVKTDRESKKYNENNGTIIIDYLQDKPDEINALEVYDAIRDKFGLKIKVNERYLNVEDVDYSFTGKDSNILEVEISFSYTDTFEKEKTYMTMKNLEMKGKVIQ